jgi:hypothetical protein
MGETMKKVSIITAIVMALTLTTASVALADEPPANAGSPTCAGVDTGHGPLVNHGDHVTVDYVEANGSASGGSPAHFGPHGVSAGASFCLVQSHAPELLGAPGRFAD